MLKSICGIADGMAVLAEPPNSVPPPGASPLWGEQAAAGARPRPALAVASAGGEPLQPLSRRLLRLAGVLSVALILVVANSLLRSEEDPFNPVAEAAEQAEALPGARFSFYVVFSSPAFPQPVTGSGSGIVNAQTEHARMRMRIASPTGPVNLLMLSDGEYNYTTGPSITPELPPGKKWLRTVSDQEDETSADFDQSLRMLSSSGKVEMLGHQSISGKTTRHYRAQIPLSTFIDLLREEGKNEAVEAYESVAGSIPTGISAEVWIDRKNLLRRLRVVMPTPGDPGDPAATVDMRMDLFGYGAHPDIQLPDADSVVDGPLDSSSATSSASIS